MSRSFKMHAAGGWAVHSCPSEKKDKKLWHKAFRSRMKQAVHLVIKNGWDDETLDWDVPFFHHLQTSETWNMQKDGKGWYFPRNHYRGRAFLEKPVRCVYLADPTFIEEVSIVDKHRIIGK
jgi:hypothetical protein